MAVQVPIAHKVELFCLVLECVVLPAPMAVSKPHDFGFLLTLLPLFFLLSSTLLLSRGGDIAEW